MTHKSFLRNTYIQGANLRDYERLEFLGDTVLDFLIARYFFDSKLNKSAKMQPKDLHNMTQEATTNALFNFVVIESGIHNYVKFTAENENSKKLIENCRKSILTKVG
jgi:dsRNA-specific ribonuclease